MEYDVHDELLSFMSSGIYRFSGSNVVFVDPVRVLSNSYSRFRINSAGYYSRFFGVPSKGNDGNSVDSSSSMKNKKRKRNSQSLNEREKSAENRHQNARPFLVSAYESFQRATDLLHFLPSLLKEDDSMPDKCDTELNFIELGSLWQAPLYEISLSLPMENIPAEGGSQPSCCEGRAVPVFNNLIRNQSSYDLEADFLNRQYILPGKCRFFMQLAHIDGALVVLWITNREKLRAFVEDELFPAWGVADISEFFWLKVKPDGSLIGELDLFHHRPYECLLLGYINAKNVNSEKIPKNKVIVSIPGSHSRKPPLGRLLSEYVPGPKPARCIDLFARELVAGWTSWGNEPLHFQDSKYFLQRGSTISDTDA
ncbi:methyltransferase-like protein 2 isoform X4 [Dioscorea cayenensis subsp. rotundata]|uniref:Methyltransferase-like protein 2 isoform X4 n=1 Tax=Dioscorea cayennensis subsp. rotundata TaxID=55577 RepID=A0AB40AWQ8_DIOCR|nr:methyltransferase-like protein 2 isoform X4 [Dioscorea cayenensis subsp. rotundata]